MKLALSLLMIASVSFAATKQIFPHSRREVAKTGDGCKVDYVDQDGFRSLKSVCGKKETSFFKLADPTAPLLEAKEFKLGRKSYLGTRWATGHAEEFVVFDLSTRTSKVLGHAISDGPSAMSLDSDSKKIKLSLVEKKGVGAEATASPKTVFFP